MPTMKTLPVLWYENIRGVRFVPPDGHELDPPPAGYDYQRSRFPTQVSDTVISIRTVPSRKIAFGSSSYWGALALSLVRPTLVERIRALWRTGRLPWTMPLDQAVLVASTACEGCANVLAWENGVRDERGDCGYPRGSADHLLARTSCELCRPVQYDDRGWTPEAV